MIVDPDKKCFARSLSTDTKGETIFDELVLYSKKTIFPSKI